MRPGFRCICITFLAVVFPGASHVISAKGQSPSARNHPTYAGDIAPILYENCAPCHHDKGMAPFPLTSFRDAAIHAEQIRKAVTTRHMPPWLPEHGYGDFEDELRLSDPQIRAISDWVRNGTPEGDEHAAPTAPTFPDGWRLGTPDLVVTAPKAFTVPAHGRDVFWNFILRPQIATGRYVKAIEIRPSNPRSIHHANVVIDRLGTVTRQLGGMQAMHEAMAMPAETKQDTDSGFPGMDVTVLRSPFDLDGHFLFWKPGTVPYVEPDGLSWALTPGSALILNTHMRPNGRPLEERPSIGLYFTSQAPTKYPYLLQLEADEQLDIPANTKDFPVSDDFTLPVDTDILGIYPHAHYLGKRLEGYATLPDGTRKWLILIPDWDPSWQAVYRYKKPLFLPKGTVLSMRYHYDNSPGNPRNPNRPPKRVQHGNQSTDEMSHLWLQVVSHDGHDSRRLYAQAWAENKVRKDPDNYAAQLMTGALALTRLNPTGAESALRQAVRLEPGDPVARNLLGTALAATGRNVEAIEQFRQAVALDPGNLNARFNLARALAKSGQTVEAERLLEKILEEHRDDPTAKTYLQQLHQQLSRN